MWVFWAVTQKKDTSFNLELLETIRYLEGKGYGLRRQLDPAPTSAGGVKQGRKLCPLSYGTTARRSNEAEFKAL